MRKLASIQKIQSLEPIEGKDRIELATVLGWHVIVQKGVFEVDGLCVFCEPDSLMPETPDFEFLRSRKFKIKTIRMAGVTSQGICFPLSILPGCVRIAEGEDVTAALGVRNYHDVAEEQRVAKLPPMPKDTPFVRRLMKCWLTRPVGRMLLRRSANLRREAEKFPDFIAKTDETRIQAAPFYLEGDRSYVCREKLDGSSLTAFLVRKRSRIPFVKDRFEYGVCSRNRRLMQDSVDAERFLSVAKQARLEQALNMLIGPHDWVAIQGEAIGPGFQGNVYGLPKDDFYVFNLIVPGGKIQCTIGEVLAKAVGLKWCPMVGVIESPMSVDDVLAYATGKSQINPDVLREGVVCRNYAAGISFKAVSPEYLLQHDQ